MIKHIDLSDWTAEDLDVLLFLNVEQYQALVSMIAAERDALLATPRRWQLVFAEMNDDEQMRVEVRKDVMHGTGFRVTLHDLDSGNQLPHVDAYPTQAGAIRRAQRLIRAQAAAEFVNVW